MSAEGGKEKCELLWRFHMKAGCMSGLLRACKLPGQVLQQPMLSFTCRQLHFTGQAGRQGSQQAHFASHAAPGKVHEHACRLQIMLQGLGSGPPLQPCSAGPVIRSTTCGGASTVSFTEKLQQVPNRGLERQACCQHAGMPLV